MFASEFCLLKVYSAGFFTMANSRSKPAFLLAEDNRASLRHLLVIENPATYGGPHLLGA
jgi:hypothetical protein